ncbi:MAG: nucleotidyltransferase [Bacilli bacterium]|nr:nucleotidyltransferase [Bacilli bacterium]
MSVGIICEYNPFHNGHLYHLKKIKQMYPDDVIVLILSGNYTQRGDFSIIDKWKKTEIAKKAGIDLIVELPFAFATQSADFFSYGAVTLLEKLKVEKLVFGSESDDISNLYEIAKCQIDNKDFDKLVKIYSKFGYNYPTAINNAVYDLTNKKVDTPNDLLGVSYIKTILENNYHIKPICIKRDNNYHDLELKEISGATSIRMALEEGKNVSNAVPDFVIPYLNKLHFKDNYFSLLKYKVITENDLSIYQTVDEGLENKIKKVISSSNSYDEVIEKLKTKRYTYNKISRMLLHILVGFTKEMAKEMTNIQYIRVLGFNNKGQEYLNRIKKDVDIPILSKFVRNNKMLEFELKTTIIYSIPYNDVSLVEEEYKNHLRKEV